MPISNKRSVLMKLKDKIASLMPELNLSAYFKKKNRKKEFGINLFGFFNTENGVGQTAKQIAKVIKHSKIPHTLIDLDDACPKKEDAPYPINLIYTNADHLIRIFPDYKKIFRNKYNVGYWAWELPEFPDYWKKAFNYLDEIWCGSDFCFSTLSLKTDKPVVKITPFVYESTRSSGAFNGKMFGMKDNLYTFLFIYDPYSYTERKNPVAILKAYRLAFKNNEKVQLVIKSAKMKNIVEDPVKEYISKHKLKNVILIEDYLNRPEILGLIRTCDCYISLHRSEGLGLTIMEAMAFGKPVIATAYSGNLDFTNWNNCFLVKYKLIKIKKDIPNVHGPQYESHYKKGGIWADTSVKDAALKMRYVYLNKEKAREIGSRGERFIKDNYNIGKASGILSSRLDIIKKRRRQPWK